MQAVKVHAVKTGLCARVELVPVAQPLDKTEHDRVAPHPLREAFEIAERCVRAGVFAVGLLEVAIDAQRVWPVRFKRHYVKSFLLDEPPR